MSLGKMKKINDLRSVWAHEEYDFSKWLSQEENLSLLSDAIGIDIVLEELESPVGGFSVDLYATEEGTGRKIIIENQLEDTNHDHLGKIITYAAGKNAEVIVWVVKHARDEHRRAVEWLNQHTDSDIGVFLIEIELWQIDNSPLAPMFKVVEKPNDWTKSIKVAAGLSETKKLQLEFWQHFADFAFSQPEFANTFSRREPKPRHWYNLSVGKAAYHIALTVNTQKNRLGAELYITDDKQLFEVFKTQKTAFETEVGAGFEWIEADKACRILTTSSGSIKKQDSWQDQFLWLMDMAQKIKKATIKLDK